MAVLTLAASCSRSDDARPGGAIEFGASVCDGPEVLKTRTLVKDYIKSDPFDMDFYIQLCCDTAGDGTYSYRELGTYVVPSGYEGRLASKETGEELMWKDLLSRHVFYAWNIPWEEDGYTPSDEAMEIEFHNSSENDGYDKFHNNAIYENFIGAGSDPVSYKEQGRYVDITFHHLVSRIRIGSFVLIEAGGAIQKNLKADMTFIGMPTKATFYPCPPEGGRPYVGRPWDSDKDNGVTYYVENEPSRDIFYICPEVDFSTIDFKIKVNNDEYSALDTYYGTFDDVVFTRVPGEDYDAPSGGDDRILHAGEEMTLDIVLIPGVGPGLAIIIDKWDTEEKKESQYHTHQGIYSDAEMKEMHSFFRSQRYYSGDPETDEAIEKFFDMYGEEKDIDGDGKTEKVFTLYENVDLSKEPDGNIFPVPPGYVIDGMGHTITLKMNGSTAFVRDYFNVGPVRDVYITDGGDHTIYIDKQGYVWIFDSVLNDFVLSQEADNRLVDFEGNEKSYDIGSGNGKVHRSTYYNNYNSGT